MLSMSPNFYRPQTKLREGNVFTPVCDSVHGGGGRSLSKGVSGGLWEVSVMETSPYSNVTGPLGLWMFERPGEL